MTKTFTIYVEATGDWTAQRVAQFFNDCIKEATGGYSNLVATALPDKEKV